MKRVSCLVLALVLLLPFAFLSCSNADHKALVGRWETEGSDEELGTYSMVYHFTEEGEIFVEQKQGDDIPFSIPFGSWYAEGNRLTIKSDGTEKTFTFSVSDSKLTLSKKGEESLIFHRI
ncbi:MAG: hypothetical protein E7580_01000 [Ruminococcaceae bacterium]|nr:hypothetical protein [Oscillospiraceae bacterium]